MKKARINSVLREFTIVPIYDVHLHLVVSRNANDVPVEQSRMSHQFGGLTSDTPARGQLAHCEDRFGIFLSRADLSHGLVAHEIFHATCRIMEFVGDHLTEDRHEPHAYLVEWITAWVYAKLKGERFSHNSTQGSQ